MTPFRSDSRLARLFGVAVIALVALPFTIGGLRMSGRVIVQTDDVVDEDLYAFGELVLIEGVVDGDLLVIAGEVRISGTVAGDVLALVGGPLDVSGTVGGSVRAAAVRTDIEGMVSDDLVVASVETNLPGSVGRDVILVGGEATLAGEVGRDVRLQSVRLGLEGSVGRDVLVRVDTLSLGSGAAIDGDLLYQATHDATVADGAGVDGQFTRRDVLAPVWAKAVTRVFSILSLFGLIVAGLVAMWLFRGSSRAAVAEVEQRPWRSAAIGAAALLVIPMLMLPLLLTLVGIPVALLLLVVWVVALLLGPIPAVTHFGAILLRGRGGLAGALVVGAVLWRASMWALPLIGGLIYLAALLVGLGAYVSAGWRLRRGAA